MAYSDDIAALNPDHHWPFDGDADDDIASANFGPISIAYPATSAIAEDATVAAFMDAATDSLAATAATISGQFDRKAVGGWVEFDSIQLPPKNLWTEGDRTRNFSFKVAFGNSLLFEVVDTVVEGFILQAFSDRVLEPDRAYHILGVFEGDAFADEIRLYVDGVEQSVTQPSPATVGADHLDARSAIRLGSTFGQEGIGGDIVDSDAAEGLYRNHWAAWSGAGAVLTLTEVREELFEKGALPGATISAGTEAAMQTALDALADTVRPNEALNIRIEAVTGDGDVELTADNITHDTLASIHVQYMGTGTLTWINSNGSDASIGSTPAGGTIEFVEQKTLTVTVRDAETNAVIENARVYMEAAAGGSLAEDTAISNALTNASGVSSIAFNFIGDQPVRGNVGKHDDPYYVRNIFTGTITTDGFDITVLLVRDE